MANFWNKEGSGELIFNAHSRPISIPGYVLLSEFLRFLSFSGVIFSDSLSADYYSKEIPSQNSILRIGSIPNRIFALFDISSYYTNVESSRIVILLGTLIIIYITLTIAYFRFDLITNMGKRRRIKKTFAIIFSMLLNNYNLIFLIITIQCLNIPFCRTSSKFETYSIRTDGYLTDETNQYYYDSLGQFFNSSTQNITEMGSLSYSYISQKIRCYSATHILVIILSLILHTLNCLFWNIALNFKSMAPSLQIRGGFYRKSIIHFNEIVMHLFFLSKPVVETLLSKDSHTKVDVVFYLYLFSMTMVFVINSIYHSMYIDSEQKILNLRSLYFMIMSFVAIAVKKQAISLLSDELSCLLILCLVLAASLRLNNNLIGYYKRTILLGIKDLSKPSKTELMFMYFEVMKFVDSHLKLEECNNLEFKILAEHLLKIHYDSCYKPNCICKNRKVFLEDHPLEKVEERVSGTRIVDLMIIVSESLLKFNKRRENVSEEVLNCSLYFHICFLGDLKYAILESNRYLSDCKKKRSKASTAFMCLFIYLKKYIIINNKEGAIGLRQYKSLIIEEEVSTMKSTLDMRNYLSITMIMKEVKLSILGCSEIMIEYTKNIHSEGTLEYGFSLASAFMEQKNRVFLDMNQIRSITSSTYRPLLIIYAHFLAHIHQNRKSAAKVYASIFSKSITSNLNRYFGELAFSDKSHEAVVIIMEQGRSTKNSIKYCTSNCLDFLGWISDELLGRQIETFIAQPYARWHNTIMRLGNGKFTALQSPRDVFCVGKDGFLRTARIVLRHNLNINNTLQYGGCLQFPLNQDPFYIIITDNDGVIQGMTENASKHFRTHKNIVDLNKQLLSIIMKCLRVSQEIYAAKDGDVKESISVIVDEDQRIKDWKVYKKWHFGSKIRLLCSNNQILTLVCRVSCLRIPYTMGRFSFRFELFGQEIFRDLYNQNDFGTFNKRLQDDSLSSINSMANKTSINEIKNMKLRGGSRGKDKESFISFNNSLQLDRFSRASRAFFQNLPISHLDDEISIEGESCLSLKGRMQRRLAANLVRNYEYASTTTTIAIHNMKLSTIEMIIHSKINFSSFDASSWALTFMLILLLALHLILIYLRGYFTVGIFTEVTEVGQVVDNFNWGIWAQVGFPFYMDLCRLTYEGVFSISYGESIGYATMWDKCSETMKWIDTYLITSDLKIDAKTLNISYPEFANTNSWIYFTSNYTSKEDKEKDWVTKRISRLSVIKPLQIEMIKIMNRNYSSGELNFIRAKNGSLERELDQGEELIRKNLIGEFNLQYAVRSYEFYKYIKDLFNINITFHIWTVISIWIISLMLYFSFIIYKYCECLRMKEFYRKLYLLEAKSVEKTIRQLEKKREFLIRVLQDEEPEHFQTRMENNSDNGMKKARLGNSLTMVMNRSPTIVPIKKATNNSHTTAIKRKNWIRINFAGYNFGFSWLYFMLFILVLLLEGFQLISLLIIYPKVSRDRDIAKTYILNTEVWNSFFTLHCVFFNTIFWNNTVEYWGTDSLSTFVKLENYIQNEVVANISSTLEYDIDNYTQDYRDVMTKVRQG